MLQATRRVSIVEDEVDLAGTECKERRSLTDQALAEVRQNSTLEI